MGSPRRVLTGLNALASGLLAGGLITGFVVTGSLLALAQGADSLVDLATAGMLAWAAHVAAQPPDEAHPFGHHRAEPIAALVTAIVAGVLAVEVIRSAATALWVGDRPSLPWWLVGVFAGKVAVKLAIGTAARRALRTGFSPALDALAVDARNDVTVSGLAIVGFAAARLGWPALDAWLAIPAGIWIAWAGFDLAVSNIRLLMGEAPSESRLQELGQVARRVPGVRDIHEVRAQHLGTHLHVHLHAVVDAEMTVKEAHDLGEAVRAAVEEEQDVHHCEVHLDVE